MVRDTVGGEVARRRAKAGEDVPLDVDRTSRLGDALRRHTVWTGYGCRRVRIGQGRIRLEHRTNEVPRSGRFLREPGLSSTTGLRALSDVQKLPVRRKSGAPGRS